MLLSLCAAAGWNPQLNRHSTASAAAGWLHDCTRCLDLLCCISSTAQGCGCSTESSALQSQQRLAVAQCYLHNLSRRLAQVRGRQLLLPSSFLEQAFCVQASSRAGAALRHGSLLLSQCSFRLSLVSDCSAGAEAAELLQSLTKAGQAVATA